MKKWFGLLALVLTMSACDDGDAVVDTVTFNESAVEACGNLVYKITDNQALIITLPETNTLFTNDQTLPGVPRTLAIGGTTSVVYRVYSGAVTSNLFCITPPPINPVATLEWTATAGTIEVNTIAVYGTPDAVTGQTKIANYRHTVTIRGLKFAKPDGTDQNYTEYVVGNRLSSPDNNLPFSFEDNPLQLCTNTNTIYNALNSGAEGLSLENVDAALLDTSVLNTPKTALIGTDNNKLIYRLLEGSVPADGNANYYCNGGTTPIVKELWNAETGVTGVSGIIEVVTVAQGNNFQHTIRLKAVTFRKGNSTFYYGNDMLYGVLLTS